MAGGARRAASYAAGAGRRRAALLKRCQRRPCLSGLGRHRERTTDAWVRLPPLSSADNVRTRKSPCRYLTNLIDFANI